MLCDQGAGDFDVGFLGDKGWTHVKTLPGPPKHVLARSPRGGLVDASGYNSTSDIEWILATGMVVDDPVLVDVSREIVEAAISQRQLQHTPSLEAKAAAAAAAIQRLEEASLIYDSAAIAHELFG